MVVVRSWGRFGRMLTTMPAAVSPSKTGLACMQIVGSGSGPMGRSRSS